MNTIAKCLAEAKRIAKSATLKDQLRHLDHLAALVMADMENLQQEELWVILLTTRNDVMSIEHLYKGSLNTTIVRIAEVFRAAILTNAAAIALVHNHPSGDPTPSAEDITLTKNVIRAGKLLDIEVMDHLVVAGGTYVSMKQRGHF